ncbi:hypothetical protein D3C77_381070 [compost metagenome]
MLIGTASKHLHLFIALTMMYRIQLRMIDPLTRSQTPISQKRILQKVHRVSANLQMRIAPKAQLPIEP